MSNSDRNNEIVIGDNNAVQVTDPTAYPSSAVTKLIMAYSNGATIQYYIGSGILVSPEHVLSVGHNFVPPLAGYTLQSVTVIPAYDGTQPQVSDSEPYGRTTGDISNVLFPKGYNTSDSLNDDIALLHLNDDIGTQAGWVPLGAFANPNDANGMSITSGNILPTVLRIPPSPVIQCLSHLAM